MHGNKISIYLKEDEVNVFPIILLVLLGLLTKAIATSKNKNTISSYLFAILILIVICISMFIIALAAGKLVTEHVNQIEILAHVNLTKEWTNTEKINAINKYILFNPKIEIVFPNTLDCLKTHVHELELIQHLNVLKVLAKQAEKYDTRVLEIQNVPVEDLSDMNIPIVLVFALIAVISYKIVSNYLNNNK